MSSILPQFYLRILEQPDELALLEGIQRQVWIGAEIEIVPAHMLIAAVHNGGLAIGAYLVQDQHPDDRLVGFVFGFPGVYSTPDGPRLKHHSHMLAVLPDQRDLGVGFALKRAQWQMVRKQGIDRITWTYDPLQSRNAFLNISRLGTVCNTYLPDYYGPMRDGLNQGLSSDRFQVDWWVNSMRVNSRLSRRVRSKLDFNHYSSAGARIINPSQVDVTGWTVPLHGEDQVQYPPEDGSERILMLEIPADINSLKAAQPEFAHRWREYTRPLFLNLFAQGYLVTDFIHTREPVPRSFYILVYGESTL